MAIPLLLPIATAAAPVVGDMVSTILNLNDAAKDRASRSRRLVQAYALRNKFLDQEMNGAKKLTRLKNLEVTDEMIDSAMDSAAFDKSRISNYVGRTYRG